jgi:hypothetical protein
MSNYIKSDSPLGSDGSDSNGAAYYHKPVKENFTYFQKKPQQMK